ncbi:hypothetical protein [Nocardia sp. NPDC050413]|uniref:hypothetical protein n=1 Tax=Nocardia sp. NPDC050413 TaxID=3155784 RepID=UPI0033F2EF3B
MDPAIMAAATAAASAVSAGLVAGITDTSKAAIADAYRGFKDLLTRKYGSVDVEIVEQRPAAPSRQVVLAEELGAAGADEDPELIEAVQRLWRVIAEQAPAVAETVGVRLDGVEAGGDIEISDITTSSGAAAHLTEVRAGRSIKITGIHAGDRPDPSTAPE